MKMIRKIEAALPTVPIRKKVAAYARISEEKGRTLHSLAAQVSFYSNLIQSKAEWEYAGVYADSGVSGTTDSRSEFRRMLADCEAGKIDIILAKSVSRFARNTVDSLTTVRQLKEKGIEIYFEKENIWTLDSKGELLISIMSSLAQMVQRELARRCRGRNRHSGVHDFSGKIKCGECGSWYGSKVWHSNDKYRRVIWQCNHKYDGKKCSTPHVYDKTIEALLVKAANKLISERDAIKADYEAIKIMLFSTEELSAKTKELKQEMEVVSGMIQDCINENARVALDQTDFQNRYESLVKRFDDIKSKYDAVCAEIDDKRIRQATVEQFLADLTKHDTVLTEFELEAWHSLVDCVTVYGADDIRFTFKNGKEI